MEQLAVEVQQLADELELPGVPKKDTIHRIFRDPQVPPSSADVVAVAAVLARHTGRDGKEIVDRIRMLWRRAWAAPPPYGMIRVREAKPRLLGVHASIKVDADLAELPTYIPRDMDSALCAAIVKASVEGGLLLLVGDSSVGKTRSLAAAVQKELPEWWLLHPADIEAIKAFAAAPMPRTVVWLNDLQNYLDSTAGLTHGIVRTLIMAGSVVVATMWPRQYGDAIAPPETNRPDPGANQRQLLALANVINVADTFSDSERRRAEALAAEDPRIRVALGTSDIGLTQTLAGAPQLVERWNNADCYARAVLAAAVDAARLGVKSLLTSAFLEDAAPGYCSEVERATAPADWLDHAMAYSTRKLVGAAYPLAPIAGGTTMGITAGYRLADYLLQHVGGERAQHCPPATFWEACITHVTSKGDLGRLGHAADIRMRYRYAIPLLRRAVGSDPFLDERLGWLLIDQNQIDEGLSILRPMVATNPLLAHSLPGFEAALNEQRAALCSATLTAETRKHLLKGLEGTLAVRRLLADAPPAVREERLRAMFGTIDLEALRKRDEAGDVNASLRLINLLGIDGQYDHLMPIVGKLIDAGVPLQGGPLIAALILLGREEEALRLVRFGLTADGEIASAPAPDTLG